MLTKQEAQAIKIMIKDWPEKPGGLGTNAVKVLSEAIDRATDTYETNDVIARGPNISSTNMLNDAAKALGWRTDFATGDSPITWELVLDEIVKLVRGKPRDATVACVGDRYDFKYDQEQFNCTLEVTRVTGYRKNDLVFFDDGSHSKQEKMMTMTKLDK